MLESITKFSPRKRFAFDLSLILFFSILVCVPILLDGIPSSIDIPQQYQMAQSFYDSILSGNIYPSWADQPNFGYGDVSVRFYPPLAYYILSFFRFVSGNWFDATCLFFVTLFFISGVGVYLFSRQFFAATASLIASIMYIWLPYHVMQIYVGSLFAEFTAAAILPFCLLFINRVCDKGRLIDMCGLALTFALILLTHLPTTIIASMTFFVYALFTIKKNQAFQTLWKLAISVFFSFLLSSFYLVRMMTEFGYVKHSTDTYSTGFYSYKTQFVFSYLFPFTDAATSSPTALMNMITMIMLGILIPGLIYYYRKSEISSLGNVVAISIFSLIMATPLSLWIWKIFPLLQKIQFPFRWLTILTFGTAIFAAAGFTWAIKCYKTPQRYLTILIFGLLFISFPYTYARMMNPYITYPRFFLNSLTNGFKTMPSCECWWTTWAAKAPPKEGETESNRPDFLPDKVAIYNRGFEIKTWTATDRTFIIKAGEAGQSFAATLYYPHWKATVNGQFVKVTSSATGLISFPVPAEQAEVRLFFQEPPHVILTYYLSALAWFFLLVLLLFGIYKSSKPQSQNSLNVQ